MSGVLRRGRLGDMSSEALSYTSSMGWDEWLFNSNINVDRAHVLMLYKTGNIVQEDAKTILGALDDIERGGYNALKEGEDIHEAIETRLISMVGENVGGRMHMARSRNDEVATCLRISTRTHLLDVFEELLSLRNTLLTLAEKNLESLMPGFTHLQHAQPTTLAHHLLAHEQSLSRGSERIIDTFRRVNLCPLGAGAFASTPFKIDRQMTAKLLGFDGVLENSMDAVSTRDFVLETLATLSLLMLDISRLTEEFILWSTEEFGFVEIDDRYASTSSIMPQKKNPDVAEIARSRCGTVIGALTASLIIGKALPYSYNRDLQEMTPHLIKGLEYSSETLQVINGMVKGAVFNLKRMRDILNTGFVCATDLADALVQVCNLPFRTAHTIVGKLSREGIFHPTLEEIELVAEKIGVSPALVERGLTEEHIKNALDPMGSIRNRLNLGGPSPKQTGESIKRATERLNTDTKWLTERREHINSSLSSLNDECKTL